MHLGGIKVCGWSAQNLGKELGLHRNTVGTCIKKLESLGYLTLLVKYSNKKNKVYVVNV